MNDKYTGYFGQKFRGDYRPRTRSSSSQALFTYPRRVILSLLTGRPRIFPYPRTEYWAWPFSYAGYIYENGYWAWPAPMQFGHRVSISPHTSKISKWPKYFQNFQNTTQALKMIEKPLEALNYNLNISQFSSLQLLHFNPSLSVVKKIK